MVKALLIHDMERENEFGTVRWAYANRTHGLCKVAPKGWDVSRISIHDALLKHTAKEDFLSGVDVVLNLDYQSVSAVRAMVGHEIPIVSSFNKDTSANTEYWRQCYSLSDYVICNNRDRYLWAVQEGFERVCYITNGVDTEFWDSTRPLEERTIDVAWCGSTAPKKKKGYPEIVLPLAEALSGLSLSFRPVLNAHGGDIYCAEHQKEWYSRSKIFLCVSASEGGGPSSLMEAMACGCIPVTVNIGSIPEFGQDGVNCRIIERSVESAAAGVRAVLDAPESHQMSREARNTIRQHYAYGGERGPDKWFYRLLERVAHRQVIEPFDYQERPWETI